MLQLQTKSINICRITKLLVKYKIKASITDSVITLNGDVSDELLTELCTSINVSAVQNFISQEPLSISKETSFIKSEECIQAEASAEPETIEAKTVEEPKEVEPTRAPPILSNYLPEYNLIYSEVKRGEVYQCDFGEPYGSEQGFMRYAIIIQNDDGNLHSPTTIVIACTTEHKKVLPVHFHCQFSSKNMLDYDLARVGSDKNTIMAEQIQTVDKKRLRKYIGTLTPEFMRLIEEKVYISLGLRRNVTTIEKKVSIDKPLFPKTMVDLEVPKERRDVNMVQVQLLSYVDINELLKIARGHFTDEIKAQKILELFDFNFSKNGVQYLLKAIIVSPKDVYFNLETLCESVSEIENIDKEEIKRLIVARVKERFGFKKSPTIDLIRLINNFLEKQEVDHETTNI